MNVCVIRYLHQWSIVGFDRRLLHGVELKVVESELEVGRSLGGDVRCGGFGQVVVGVVVAIKSSEQKRAERDEQRGEGTRGCWLR